MGQTDTWRTLGFESDITAVQLIAPTAVTNVTPVVWPSASTGIDMSGRGRRRILVVIDCNRTAQGVTFTVTESATTNGTYAAATTSGTLTKMTASGVQYVSVKFNPAKPFLRVTATGDNAATNITAGVTILYI
jgi:hypothetical protein